MMRRRLKIAFLTLLGLVVIGMTSGILYLESESFAESVKRMISERSPQKLGVVGDFSNLRLYFFPPGIGIASPKIRVSKENVSQIPIDGKVEAKELRVSFTPIKLISGILEVSEVYVVGGAIQGTLYAEAFKTKPKKKEEGLKLNWRDLFELQINGFRLEDTYLNLVTLLPGANHEQMTTELVVKNLMIQKKRIEGRDGLISTATVNAVRIEPPTSLQTIPIKEANQLQWDIELTDQGLTLNPFTADLSGIRFRLDGAIHGNLLDELSHPQIEAEAQIHSDLSTFFLANMNDDHWGGSIEARAKLSAELKRPAETLKAQFTVQGSDLVWKELKARLLDAQGELDLSSKKLTLKSFRAQDRGDLKLSSTVIPLQFNEPCEAQVDLTDADIHWLGGSVASAVAPLEGKISGKIHAQFLPGRGKSWRLKTTDELSVDHFELNDQKHPILKPVLPIKLQGGVEVTPEGVDFTDLKVNLAKTALLVDGGVHPGHGGFGINGKGYVSLKEFNEIAGNEIRGEGNLEARVSGPSSNVLLDFFPHLKDASYLGLHFGNLDGKVTYDDGVSELRFDSIHANYQNTYYSLDQGFIDLSGGDDIKLPFDIHSGRLEDLAQVLDKLVSKVSWFPKSLKGEIHGTVSLEGKISTPRLKVLGEIEGSDWIWLGERARRVKMSVGFDQGT